jgi:hypothetical protein
MADPRYVNLTAPAGGYESQLANIVRRQKMAELLAQQGSEDIKVESVGGIPTPISPFQGLAKALQSGMGAYLGSKADEDLATAKAKEAKDVSDIFAGLADRPDVKTEGYYLPAEQPSKTMPIGMPRGASSFMPEGEATNMGTYVPGTVTPGQRLSRSEKTNRIMAAMAAHPSMAALAPMYVQNMQSEVEDQRYQAGLDRAEAARVLEATRYAEEQKQKAADDAESLRRYEKTLAATNAGRSPGTPQSYLVDGKPFFGTPQDALDLSRQGKIVTTPKTDKPETQFQASSAGFADRMITANKYITDPAVIAAATSQAQMRRGNVPVIGNYLTSDAKKSLDQAKLSFVNAKLRQESGATIGDPEFVKADLQYFPQPGDGPEQIKQKEIERNIVINGMVRSAGPDYERLDPEKQELEYRRSLKARGG